MSKIVSARSNQTQPDWPGSRRSPNDKATSLQKVRERRGRVCPARNCQESDETAQHQTPKAARRFQAPAQSANAFDDFSQEARSILEASAVIAFTNMRAQKLMPQITVTMFHVYKIKTDLASNLRRSVKRFDDPANLAVCEQRVIVRQSQSLVQKRVMIKYARRGAAIAFRATVPTRMRQLQTDKQIIRRACCLFDVQQSKHRASEPDRRACCSLIKS